MALLATGASSCALKKPNFIHAIGCPSAKPGSLGANAADSLIQERKEHGLRASNGPAHLFRQAA